MPSGELPRFRLARLKKSFPSNFRIRGRQLDLRPIRVSDATMRYCRWLNDPEVNRFTESRYTRHTLGGVRAYVKAALKSGSNFFFAMIDRESGKHVGNIKIDSTVNPHWDHLVGEVGLIVGEKKCWGRGYGSEAIVLVTGFAFKKLGLRKLTATCLALNRGSAKAFRKAGYKLEARRRANARHDGKQVDLLLFGAINPRYLRRS